MSLGDQVLSTKMAEGWINFLLNLTLTCYYFETLLLSRDVNTPGDIMSTKMAEG